MRHSQWRKLFLCSLHILQSFIQGYVEICLAVSKEAPFVYFPESQGLILKDISGIYTDFHILSRVKWQ